MQLPVQEGTNSFVAPAATVTTPSIVVAPEQSPSDMPSIIVIGKPTDTTARVVDGEARPEGVEGGAEIIKVVRGGDAGGPYPPPAPPAADPLTQPGVPMLDPNDRGTPAKRNALRKQEERLAREAAAAAQNAQQPAPAPSQ